MNRVITKQALRALRRATLALALLSLLAPPTCWSSSAEVSDNNAANPASSATRKTSQPDKQLDFIKKITGGGDPTKPLPLIVALHGMGASPESFVHIFDGFTVPARVVVLRAPLARKHGWAWFPSANVKARDLKKNLRKLAAQIASLVKSITALHPTSGKAIVTGFSQGGMLAYTLASIHPELFSAVVSISGYLPRGVAKKPAPGTKLPLVVAYHGTDDTRIPLSADQAGIETLRGYGYEVDLRLWSKVGHTMSPAERADHRAFLARFLDKSAATAK